MPRTLIAAYLFALTTAIAVDAAPSPVVSFFARRDTVTAVCPGLLATGDFNNDGKPDIAVICASQNSLQVGLGTGQGNFKMQASINAGLEPEGLALGDFNNDGNLDIAVVSESGLGILLGKGNGAFQPLVNIRPPFGEHVVAADFNGDGKLDLLVSYINSSTLELLLGNGDGTFQPVVPIGGISSPSFLAVGDFNGDGKPDIAVASNSAGQVAIILNSGNGTFAAPQAVAVTAADTLALGDFNGDGKLDIVCATLPEPGGQGALLLLFGEGNGSLKHPTTIDAGGPIDGQVIAGDFSGTGKLDLVTANTPIFPVTSMLELLPGNGNGTFNTPTTYSMNAAAGLVAADFNGDGKLDIATGNSGGDYFSTLAVLLGQGNSTFQAAPPAQILTAFPDDSPQVGISAADLNGDGRTDFVVAEAKGVQVLLGASGNGVTAGQFIPASPNSMALSDVNGDGKPDLILTTGSNNVSVYLGNGDGTFGAVMNSNAGAAQGALAVGDFNGDGKPDLALVIKGQLTVMLGSGNGTFAAPTTFAQLGPAPVSIALGDFNHDGKLDAAVANLGSGDPLKGSSIYLLLGNGDGSFQAHTTLPILSLEPLQIVAADLTGNGNLDLVVSNYFQSFLSVYLGNGDGTFQKPAHANAQGIGVGYLVVDDFNGDGIPDIAFANEAQGDIGLLVGKGDGTFQAVSYFGVPGSNNGVSPLLADGPLAAGAKPDIVVITSSFGNPTAVTVLANISK